MSSGARVECPLCKHIQTLVDYDIKILGDLRLRVDVRCYECDAKYYLIYNMVKVSIKENEEDTYTSYLNPDRIPDDNKVVEITGIGG